MKKPEIPWSPQEAAAVNEWLSAPLGVKWITMLINRKPDIDLASSDRAALTGAKAAGYEEAFAQIAASRVVLPIEADFSKPAIDSTRD